MVSYHTAARDAAEFGLVRMVGVLAATFPLPGLISVLVSYRDYRQPAVVVLVWLALFPVAAWLVPRIRTSGLSSREALAAIAIAITTVTVVGLEQRAHSGPGQVNLAVLGTAWLLILVALSRPARVVVPGALAVFAVHAALLIHATGANLLSLTKLEAAGYILASVVVAFATLRPTVALHASVASRRVALERTSAAEHTATSAVRADRRARLALLEVEALPLLRAIAAGTLNPADEQARALSAQYAATMRRTLTGQRPRDDDQLSWLEPALATARRRGMLVNLQVIGDPGSPPPPIAAEILETVALALTGLAAQPVTVTAVAHTDDVELYLTFGEPPGCVETGWKKAVPLDPPH